ncbi:hypothetical protein [Undibacter mobilis]|nr:hypothetical protein [Undibacter mobilis]
MPARLRSRPLLLAFVLVASITAARADTAPLSAADRAWIAACADGLRNERGSAESKQRYCACMHEQFDENEPVTQTEMERMYPPLHRACQVEAGRGR